MEKSYTITKLSSNRVTAILSVGDISIQQDFPIDNTTTTTELITEIENHVSKLEQDVISNEASKTKKSKLDVDDILNVKVVI